MKRLLLPLVAAAFVAMTTHSATAQVLANWNLDGLASTATSAVVSGTAATISSTDLFRKAGSGSAGWPDALGVVQNNAAVSSLATAISANDYFSFTLTPTGSASYSSLFLRISVQANTQPATTVFNLLSGATGFTSSDSIGSFSVAAAVAGGINGSNTYDLTGVTALQNNANAVQFRVYYYNTGANAMTRVAIGRQNFTDGLADLTVNGTVVPEPGTALLCMAGLGGLALLRRRRRS